MKICNVLVLAAVAVTAQAQNHYVGSQACAKCHQQIYEHWKKTPMANVVRDPREHPDAIIPDLATNDVSPFTKDQVAFVYGSIWKQRYFTKVGEDYFPLPVQWEVLNHKWSKYQMAAGTDWWTAFYPADNMHCPTGPLCDGCHSVGYDIRAKQVAEWNVGCERCHGPGSEHAAHPALTNIKNPGKMDYVAASDTCIQCHSQGQPLANPIEGKYYDWPVGYNAGLKLQDYWKLEEHTLGAPANFLHFPEAQRTRIACRATISCKASCIRAASRVSVVTTCMARRTTRSCACRPTNSASPVTARNRRMVRAPRRSSNTRITKTERRAAGAWTATCRRSKPKVLRARLFTRIRSSSSLPR